MITVLFRTESHFPVNRKKIREAIVNEIGKKFSRDVEVSVSVIGDRKMKDLNTSYRKKDSTTDVLSFPQNDPSQPSTVSFVEEPDNVFRLGDIVVSYPQTVEEAMESNTLVDDKMIELVLHGLNHLQGIHHEE